jgi:Fur family transcriptional regulator, ferric uptake regulator
MAEKRTVPVAKPHQPLSGARYDEIQSRLRRIQVRVTPQRVLVLDALLAGKGHITAEDILQKAVVSYPALNLATVYRTLDIFIAKGLVSRADLGGNAAIFELVGEAVHHHLICERCGAVMAVDDTLLHQTRMTILEKTGFTVTQPHLALFGICRGCRVDVIERDAV